MWGRSDLDRRESELENWDRVGAEDRGGAGEDHGRAIFFDGREGVDSSSKPNPGPSVDDIGQVRLEWAPALLDTNDQRRDCTLVLYSLDRRK